MAKKPTALVYRMAEVLSEKLGAEVIISSHTVVNTSGRGPEKGRRYDVLIKREGHHFYVPDFRLNDLTKALAMFSDWVSMGFVRLLPDPYYGPGSIVTWGHGRFGARVITNDNVSLVLDIGEGRTEIFRKGLPAGLRPAEKVGILDE